MKKIFVVGSLNMDLRIESPYMPKAGETITGSGFITNGGGKGANQAVAAAKLGGSVRMCGVVGNDAFGKTLIDNLTSAGADASRIRIAPDAPTGIAVIIVAEGNNRIILDKGTNALLSKNDIDEFLTEATAGDIYLTQLENSVDVIGYGLKKAKEKGMFTILNPAPRERRNREIFPVRRSDNAQRNRTRNFRRKRRIVFKRHKRDRNHARSERLRDCGQIRSAPLSVYQGKSRRYHGGGRHALRRTCRRTFAR